MLIGYMRVSKADGSQGYRFAARRADCRRGRSSTSLRGPGIRHARGSARLDELPEGVANWRHTGRVETGSARTRPATSHQHRARPDWARHRLEGINRARRGHRHHDRRRQAGLWHLRRPGRVRARVDRGAHDCRPSLGPRARAERRPAVQDDRRQAAAGDGGNGSARDQGRRPVPELGVTRQTLYRHVSPKGELRPDGEKLLSRI